MNDLVDGNGMPEAPIGPTGGDGTDEIEISNKGQRIGVILVAIVLLAAGAGFFVMHSNKQKQIAEHDKLKADFAREHNAGYEEFWKAARIDLKLMKTNVDFETKLTEYLSVTSIAYARHVKEKAIPNLENAIPRYRALEAAGIMLPELKAVTFSLEKLLGVWNKFCDEVMLYENYLAHQAKLDELGGKWMTVQQSPKDEKARPDAAKYLKIINCVLGDTTAAAYDPWDLSLRLKDTCAKADEQAGWFRRVAFGCLDAVGETVEPDAVFDETVEKYSKIEVDNQDTKSVFGIKQCLDLSRKAFESELANEIAAAWVDYSTKKNELLKAVDARKKEL